VDPAESKCYCIVTLKVAVSSDGFQTRWIEEKEYETVQNDKVSHLSFEKN